MTRDEACDHFAGKLSDLIAEMGGPNNLWAEWYGLSYAAIRDLIQARVLPSRAMIVLMAAIESDPDFMRDVARAARDDIAILDRARGRRP